MLTMSTPEIPPAVVDAYIAAVMVNRSLPGGQDLFLDLSAAPYETVITLETRKPCSVAEEVVIMQVTQLKRLRLG